MAFPAGPAEPGNCRPGSAVPGPPSALAGEARGRNRGGSGACAPRGCWRGRRQAGGFLGRESGWRSPRSPVGSRRLCHLEPLRTAPEPQFPRLRGGAGEPPAGGPSGVAWGLPTARREGGAPGNRGRAGQCLAPAGKARPEHPGSVNDSLRPPAPGSGSGAGVGAGAPRACLPTRRAPVEAGSWPRESLPHARVVGGGQGRVLQCGFGVHG